MKFPEFIIAGFGRAGTSALLLNLGQHPDIQIPDIAGTELRFWNNLESFVNENVDEYKKRFYGKICGEKTPGYCLRSHAIKLIAKNIPNVKIILCLRNPVNRALSHFELHKRWGRVKKDEVYNFDKHKLVINEGRYIYYITNYVLPSIPIENIYFSIMEWMKKDLNFSISKVYKFLGANSYKSKIELKNLENKDSGERHYVKLFNNNDNYHIWSQKYFTETPRKELNKMYDYFKPWNQELFEFLGYEIEDWRYAYEYGQ